MRRNHNRNLHSNAKVGTVTQSFINMDKREINKSAKDGFFKTVLDSLFKFGRGIKKFFFKGSYEKPTFQKPIPIRRHTSGKKYQKKKALRHMQRDSRRANRA